MILALLFHDYLAGGIDRSVRIFHEPSSYWGNPIYKLFYNSNKLSLTYIYIYHIDPDYDINQLFGESLYIRSSSKIF